MPSPKSNDLAVEVVEISTLVHDPENARKHSEQNINAIAASLDKFGQRRPIVVAHGNNGEAVIIAGNGTVEAARSLGWTKIAITRVPKSWSHDKARAYALADNRTAELAEWDADILATQLVDLDALGWDVADLGFESLEPPTDPTPLDGDEESKYTDVVNIPQYDIVGDKPPVSALYDDTKAKTLQEKIRATDMPDEVRGYLLAATMRHVVFNYRKAAEFYPHATPEVQRLMEESALVIIDFNDAIRNGYVRLMDTIKELEGSENDGA